MLAPVSFKHGNHNLSQAPVFRRNNPSGLPEYDAEVRIPVRL